MKIDIGKIKELREKTGVSVAECRQALEKSGGDIKKAITFLRERGVEIAEKRAARPVGAGLIETYVHAGGRVAAMVELACETDFVARTTEFKNLAHELALQVASMAPADVEELEKQEYIRDPSFKVKGLITNAVAKIGENIKIVRFIRFELGQT